MRHYMWQFQDLAVPMMEDENGTLYTTGPVLAGALQVTENNLRMVYYNHRDEFDGLSANAVGASEFIRQNKEKFGIERIRADLRIWTEDDMILFADLSRSPYGKTFRKEMIQAIKAQARKSLITEEYFDSVVAQLSARILELEQQRVEAREGLRTAASAAGSALSAQRGTKPYRS